MSAKKAPSEIAEKFLVAAFDAYSAKVDKIAEKMFEQHIKPFCAKHNLTFLAGNGAWSMYRESWCGPDKHRWEKILECRYPEILDLLNAEVPGYSVNDLGSLMPDYPGAEPTVKE